MSLASSTSLVPTQTLLKSTLLCILLFLLFTTSNVSAKTQQIDTKCDFKLSPFFPSDIFQPCDWYSFLSFVALVCLAIPTAIGVALWLAGILFYCFRKCNCCRGAEVPQDGYPIAEQRAAATAHCLASSVLVFIALIGILGTVSSSSSIQYVLTSVFQTSKEILTGIEKTEGSVKDVISLVSTLFTKVELLDDAMSKLNSNAVASNGLVKNVLVSDLSQMAVEVNDTNSNFQTDLKDTLTQFRESTKDLSIDHEHVPAVQQIPDLSTLYEALKLASAVPNTTTALFDTVIDTYTEFRNKEAAFFAVFSRIRDADQFISQFTSLQNITDYLLNGTVSGVVEGGLRTAEVFRAIIFCVGFGLVILIFGFTWCCCAPVMKEESEDNNVARASRRLKRCAKCHACSSCCLLLGFIIFGAFNVAAFIMMVPGCIALQKPELASVPPTTAAGNFTRQLLTCSGNTTIMEIAQNAIGGDVEALKSKEAINEFFAKFNASVSFLESADFHNGIQSAVDGVDAIKGALSQTASSVYELALIPSLQQWSQNLTLLKANLTDKPELQAAVTSMETIINAALDMFQSKHVPKLNNLASNTTAEIVDNLRSINTTAPTIVPIIQHQIVPIVSQIVDKFIGALTGAQCAPIAKLYDDNYYSVCVWTSGSTVVIAAASILLGIGLCIMFPVALITDKTFTPAADGFINLNHEIQFLGTTDVGNGYGSNKSKRASSIGDEYGF